MKNFLNYFKTELKRDFKIMLSQWCSTNQNKDLEEVGTHQNAALGLEFENIRLQRLQCSPFMAKIKDIIHIMQYEVQYTVYWGFFKYRNPRLQSNLSPSYKNINFVNNIKKFSPRSSHYLDRGHHWSVSMPISWTILFYWFNSAIFFSLLVLYHLFIFNLSDLSPIYLSAPNILWALYKHEL